MITKYRTDYIYDNLTKKALGNDWFYDRGILEFKGFYSGELSFEDIRKNFADLFYADESKASKYFSCGGKLSNVVFRAQSEIFNKIGIKIYLSEFKCKVDNDDNEFIIYQVDYHNEEYTFEVLNDLKSGNLCDETDIEYHGLNLKNEKDKVYIEPYHDSFFVRFDRIEDNLLRNEILVKNFDISIIKKEKIISYTANSKDNLTNKEFLSTTYKVKKL